MSSISALRPLVIKGKKIKVPIIQGGMGVGVVSSWMADKALKLGTIAQVPVPDFPVDRPFYAVAPRGQLRRAAEALLEQLRVSLS